MLSLLRKSTLARTKPTTFGVHANFFLPMILMSFSSFCLYLILLFSSHLANLASPLELDLLPITKRLVDHDVQHCFATRKDPISLGISGA